MPKPSQPRPLNETERLARRKRIMRVAKRQGLVEVPSANDDAPDVDDDDLPLARP